MNITFIGLGVMGFPMAGHLASNGWDVTVYNRTPGRADAWKKQHAGTVCTTIADAVKHADIVFTCVGNDNDVRAILWGNAGVVENMRPGSILVDHTTTSAALAREIYAYAAKHQVEFLDAPVSGGQGGAEKGILTVMVGGDNNALKKALPAMECFSKNVTYMGESGSGQLTKMVNQICIAGVLQGLSEGLHFAAQEGLDANKVIEVISKGAAQSWQMENRGPTMVEHRFDFGFAIKWMCKDLAFCLDEAREKGIDLPMTTLVNGYYTELNKRGYGHLDTSALLLHLEREPSYEEQGL